MLSRAMAVAHPPHVMDGKSTRDEIEQKNVPSLMAPSSVVAIPPPDMWRDFVSLFQT
jgi:hypothetical protein